jgi:hypothetical protein
MQKSPKMAKVIRRGEDASSTEIIEAPVKECLNYLRSEALRIRYEAREQSDSNTLVDIEGFNIKKMNAKALIPLMNTYGVFKYEFELLEKIERTPLERLQDIQDTFSLKYEILATAMAVSVQVVKNKMSDKDNGHTLTHQNVDDVIKYFKIESQRIFTADLYISKV